jgi:hypothetical protein
LGAPLAADAPRQNPFSPQLPTLSPSQSLFQVSASLYQNVLQNI